MDGNIARFINNILMMEKYLIDIGIGLRKDGQIHGRIVILWGVVPFLNSVFGKEND